jgi:hypothetical protein
VDRCKWCGDPETHNGVTPVSYTPCHQCDARKVRQLSFTRAANWLRETLNPDAVADARWDIDKDQRWRLAEDLERLLTDH